MMATNKTKLNTNSTIKHDFWKNKYLPYIFFLFIVVLYGNTFNHGFVLDDDIVYAKNSFVLKGVSGIKDIFTHGYLYGFNKENDQSYRPITLTSFAIENQLFNKSSSASHVIQVILYSISCLILLKFLLELFISTPLLAYLIALLFASHPIHTETVANIKSRDEILAFIFIILSLRYLLQYITTNKNNRLIFSIVTYVLAILSKESSLALIVVIPVFIYVFSSKKIKSILVVSTIFGLFSIFYLLFRSSVLSAMGFAKNMDILNNTLIAATNKLEELATIFNILGNYLKLLIIPYPLSFDYSYNQLPIVTWSNIVSIFSLFTYLFIGFYAIIRIIKKKPDGFGFLFFLALFSLSTNIFVKIGTTLGERLLFTPSFGFIFAITYILWNKFNNEKINNKFISISLVIVLIFSFITFQRNKDWKSNFTLFQSALEVSPNSTRVQSSMATEYRIMAEKSNDPEEKNNYYEKAVFFYKKAVEIYPKNFDALYNLGVSYQSWGKQDLAKQTYITNLQVLPNHINSLNNLGSIYFNNKQYDSAMFCFKSALKIDSSNASILGNIGSIYHIENNYNEAIKYYEKSLTIDNSNKNTLNNLINACKTIKDTNRLNKYEQMNF